MKTKLAGHLPLQEAIARTIEDVREKMKLAAEECEGGEKEKVKKLVKFEKKEHGHVPSVSEEKAEYEKQSSVLDPTDPEDVEKLAAALDMAAEKVASDGIENGGESHQGGQQLATMRPVGGKQNYSFGQATKKHQVPNNTGFIVGKDNPGAKTAVPTDDHRAPGGTGAKYPAKGVLKTGAAEKSETEIERARRYGRTGAAIGLGSNLAIHGIRGFPHGIGPHAVGAAVDAGLGYGIGRGVHRLKHGPATDKKVKHSSVSELQNALTEMTGISKEAGKVSNFMKNVAGKAKGGLKRYGELMAGGKKGTEGGMAGLRPGNVLKGFKKAEGMRGEARKSTAARVATAAGVAGGLKAVHKAGYKKGLEEKKGKKKTSGVAEMRSNVGHAFRRAGQAIKDNPGKSAAGLAATTGVAGFAAGRLSKKDKQSSVQDPIQYILDKISAVENGGESKQGGEQLSNTAPVPSNAGRQMISSNSAPAAATKREAKAPRKKELKEVLTEPALTSKTDPVVQNNLRSASKGGVKIAAARAFLQKVAEEGCTCQDAGDCRYCKMQKAATSKPAA